MINHRRGLIRDHQFGADSTKSSRSLATATSAVSVSAGLNAVGSSSKVSNSGGLHESQHNKNSQGGGTGKGPMHSTSKAISVSPLMDYGKGGNNTCSGNSVTAVSNSNSHTIGNNIQTTQVIQNGFTRRKRSTPLLTEDRLMTLLLIIVALWFLYVRYEETRAFDDSENSSLPDKKHYHVPSRYSLSEEYLPASNSEKRRKYDGYSTKSRSDYSSGVGASSSVRLYHSFGDDDDSLTDSHLRGISLGDDQTEFRRDTDVYTPSDVRLKLVSHGGIDKGVFNMPTSKNNVLPKRYISAHDSGFSNRYSSAHNKKSAHQKRNGTNVVSKEENFYYPSTYKNSKNSTMGGKYGKPSSSFTFLHSKGAKKNEANTESYIPDTKSSTSKIFVPTTHHPATKAKPLNEYLATDEISDSSASNSTLVTRKKQSSNDPSKKVKPSSTSKGILDR